MAAPGTCIGDIDAPNGFHWPGLPSWPAHRMLLQEAPLPSADALRALVLRTLCPSPPSEAAPMEQQQQQQQQQQKQQQKQQQHIGRSIRASLLRCWGRAQN
jgi:hypothetical protein